MLSMIEALAFVVFPALMIFAAFSDLFTMLIPNRVSLILAVMFFALAAYLPMSWEALVSHVTCALVVFGIVFVMWQFAWVGGGDAKLATATSLWIGWDNLLDYGVIASVAGGLLTVAIMALRWNDLPRRVLEVPFIARLADKANGVPYGVALALAGLLIYPQTLVWSKLGGL
ncbi:MAG: peptidase [Methylocystis sp.]|nr:MAG: peptidase [Methylocystis sp.]